MSRIKFLNIEIDNLTFDEVLSKIEDLISKNSNSYVVTPNVDHIVQLEKGGEFLEAYKKADLILTDGKPLIWISRLYKTPIKEKVSGSDLFPQICDLASKRGYKMFFLGAAEGVAQKAADNLVKKYPGLEVVGVYSPPYGFEKDTNEINRITDLVVSAKPDILICALGTPKQELFMYRYCDVLNVPISLGLGATLDFQAGIIKRAPKWMSNCGLEWLYRMFQDPKRLFKRYFIDAIRIIPIIIKYSPRKQK